MQETEYFVLITNQFLLQEITVKDNRKRSFSSLEAPPPTQFNAARLTALFVDLFIAELRTPGTVIQQEFAEHKTHHLQTPYTGFSSIRLILSELLHHADQFDFVFDSMASLYQLTGDLGLFRNAFGYDRRELLEGYALERQKKFLERATGILKSGAGTLDLFFARCIAELLKLHFSTTETGVDGKAMTISHHALPSTSEIKSFRRRLQEGLQHIFTSAYDPEAREAALAALLDIPRQILETRRNPHPYEGEEELKQLLDFLGLAEFTRSEKHEVVSLIDRFRRRGIYPTLEPQLAELEKLLRPDRLAHKIMEMTRQADRTLDLREAEAGALKAFQSLIGKSKAPAIAVAIDTMLIKGRQPESDLDFFFTY